MSRGRKKETERLLQGLGICVPLLRKKAVREISKGHTPRQGSRKKSGRRGKNPIERLGGEQIWTCGTTEYKPCPRTRSKKENLVKEKTEKRGKCSRAYVLRARQCLAGIGGGGKFQKGGGGGRLEGAEFHEKKIKCRSLRTVNFWVQGN